MNVNAVDSRGELRQRGESRLALAPVVLRAPITREILHRRELHALRLIVDDFPLRPLGRVDAPAQVGQIRVRSGETKRTNFGLTTTRRLRDVSQSLRHGVDPRGKSGSSGRCETDKATAIEIRRFGHTASLTIRHAWQELVSRRRSRRGSTRG